MLSINCSYSHPLPPSHIPLHPLFPSNFGCGITIYNSTTIISKVVSKHNNTDSWLMLSAGLYTILLFGCYNEDCTHNASVCIDYERMLTISECHTSKSILNIIIAYYHRFCYYNNVFFSDSISWKY